MEIDLIIKGDICLLPRIFYDIDQEAIKANDVKTKTTVYLHPIPHIFSQLNISHKHNIGINTWEICLKVEFHKLKYIFFIIEGSKYLIKTNCKNVLDLNSKKILYNRKNYYNGKNIENLRWLTPMIQLRDNKESTLKKKDLEIDSIVISGGGMLSIALYGGITQIWDIIKNVNTFFVTSGGSIIIFLILIGCTSEEGFNILKSFDFTSCNPKQRYTTSIYNLVNTFGLSDGQNHIGGLLTKILKQKTGKNNITFRELYLNFGKNLVVTVTNLSISKAWYMGIHNFPDMSVIDAIMMSTCIPFIWPPREFNNHLFIDGGLVDNFPVSQTFCYKQYDACAKQLKKDPESSKEILFSIFKNTSNQNYINKAIGVRLNKTTSKIKVGAVLKSSISEYISGIMQTINEKENDAKLPIHCTLDIPIFSLDSTFNFDLTKKQILDIFKEGVFAGRNFAIK